MLFLTHNRDRPCSAHAQILSRSSLALLLGHEIINCLEPVHLTACRFDTRTFPQLF